MNTVEIIAVIVAFLVLAAFLALVLPQESDDKQKASKSSDKKIATDLSKLFSDYTNLNNDAFDAYKAMIQASFDASKTQQKENRRL